MTRFFSRVVIVALAVMIPAIALAFVPGVAIPPGAPAQVSVVEQTGDRLVVQVDIPQLQWTQTEADGAVWDVVTVAEMGQTSQVGAPLLPVLTRLVAVGPTEGVAVEAVANESESFFDVNVIPAQPPMDRSATEAPPFAFDHSAYAVDAFVPAAHTSVSDPVIIHGRRFVPVHYYPLRYNPATGELRVQHAATVTITGGLRNTTNPLLRALPASPAFAPIIDGLSLGFDRKDANNNWVTADGAMLLVVNDEYIEAIEPYVEWKRKKGYTVEVYLVSEVPGAGQNAAKLREFFYQRYHDATLPPLDYIVLVGDNEHIKTLVGIGRSAADSMFVTLDGDDYFPDTIIARFPANNLNQVNNTVRKAIMYETNPSLDRPAWFREGLAMSGSDSKDDQNATFVGDILLGDGGFDTVNYLFTSSRNFTVQNMTGAFNLGRGWTAYFGHGYATGWSSSRTPFTNADVRELTNDGMPTVITDIACDNAHFDAAAECFAEVWVEDSPKAGAAAIFAATRNTPFGYTDQLGRGVAVGHFRNDYLTFGTAAYFGKIYMYHFYPEPAGRTCEEVMQHYVIFGDPELPMWTDTPAPLVVDHAAEIETGPGLFADVVVSVNGEPVPNALVHVWRVPDIRQTARTGPQGFARLPLGDDPAVGDVHLFVTGQNGLPYEATIAIVTPPPPGDDDDDDDDDDDADDDATDDDTTDDDTLGDDDTSGDDDATDDDASGDDDDDNGGSCGG